MVCLGQSVHLIFKRVGQDNGMRLNSGIRHNIGNLLSFSSSPSLFFPLLASPLLRQVSGSITLHGVLRVRLFVSPRLGIHNKRERLTREDEKDSCRWG